MPDLLHHLLGLIDHHRYTVAGLALAALLLVGATACQPTAVSPFTGAAATRAELDAQVRREIARGEAAIRAKLTEVEQAKAEIEAVGDTAAPAYADLERQEAAWQAALTTASQAVAQFGGPAAPYLGSAIGIAGLLLFGGAAADNRRKDGVIRDLKPKPASAA